MVSGAEDPAKHRKSVSSKLISPGSAIILVAAVYLVTLGFLQLHGIWINDNGNRLILLQNIIASDYSDYSIAWPGRAIDPTFDYAPISYPFAVVKNDRLFSLYSPVFATAASPFFRLLGYPGLYVLPLISSIVMLLGISRLMDTLEAGRRAKIYAILITGLATPIWFYSMTFWEHMIAVCLSVWGIVFILRFVRGRILRGQASRYHCPEDQISKDQTPEARALKDRVPQHQTREDQTLKNCSPEGHSRRNLIIGAVLSALGIYFRDDLYALSAVLLVVVFLYSPRKRLGTMAIFIASTIVTLVPLWLFQWKAISAPFGYHLETLLLTTAGIKQHLLDRPRVFYNLYVGSSASVWASLLLSAPFWLLFILNPKMSRRSARLSVPLYGLAAIVASLFIYQGFFHTAKPIACMGNISSLFPAAPVLIFAFLRFADRQTARPRVNCASAEMPKRETQWDETYTGGNPLEERQAGKPRLAESQTDQAPSAEMPHGGTRSAEMRLGETPQTGFRLREIVWLVCLIYAVVYGLAAPRAGSWGIHWGNRLVLILYPLLATLAAANLADWQSLTSKGKPSAKRPPGSEPSANNLPHSEIPRNKPPDSQTPGRQTSENQAPECPPCGILASRSRTSWQKGKGLQAAVVALVALVSLAAQVYSISILDRKMDFSYRLNQEIAKAPEEVIVTDQWWLGQELYTQFNRKLIFRIQSQQQLDQLVSVLRDHNYTRFLYVSPPMPGEKVGPEVRDITDGGLNYWNLRLFPVDTGAR